VREAAFLVLAISGPGMLWGVMRKATTGRALNYADETANHVISAVWAQAAHPFRMIMRRLGYLKTRFRGLAKDRAQPLALFFLEDLYLVRRNLPALDEVSTQTVTHETQYPPD